MSLVSLVIPHYNRYILLQNCLQDLQNQRFADFEVLLVDDGSDQPVPASLTRLRRWPRLRWIQLPENQGRAAARNQGLDQAQAELLIFLDCDMRVEPDFILSHWQFHQLKGPGWIGQGQIIGTQDPQQKPQASIWTDASRAVFATGNVSVARKALQQAGGFDPDFSSYGFEDLELGFRLQKSGLKAAKVAGAPSWHYEPLETVNWQADLAKEKERGQGAALFYRKHPCWQVRLMAQLTPLHPLLDQLPRAGGLISEQQWRQWISQLETRHPKLALALYRGLLNRYCAQATREALKNQP